MSPSTTASRCRSWGSASSRSLPTRPSRPSPTPSPAATATSTLPRRTATKPPSAGPSPPAASLGTTFVTTKLVQDGGEDGARRAFELCSSAWPRLCRPVPDPPAFGDYYSSWRAMQELYKQAGQGDRGRQLLPRPAGGPHRPQRGHPLGRSTRSRPIRSSNARTTSSSCERGVQLESWGPFAEGRNHYTSDPTLSQIGAAHHKSVAQVVLRWLIQRQVAANPKSDAGPSGWPRTSRSSTSSSPTSR